MKISIEQDILKNETKLAEENRKLFTEKGLMVVNLLAAPGAGKTSLIKSTAHFLKVPTAVIEGDPASSIDTDLLNSMDIPAFQINTEGGCHLEAPMIAKALTEFKVEPKTLLFVENVGNLICTAYFPLGEALRVVMLSIAEGDDKPYKYPDIFRQADAVVINKIDLKAYVEFNSENFYKGIKTLNPKVHIFEVSCKNGTGVETWVNWLAVKAATFWAHQ
jgi:hydrogenase nickel incorporation protein HypB